MLHFVSEMTTKTGYAKRLLMSLVAGILLFSTAGSVMAASDECATQYPIVLVHGMAASAEILGIVDYWGAVDSVLKENGADVHITSVNGMDSTRDKAEHFAEQFMYILEITKAEKLNIIAHSHGAIYTRDAISNLGLEDYVASHTSIAGPHQGSSMADAIVGIVPDRLEWLVGGTFDLVYSFIFGDTDPDSLDNAYDVTRPYMQDVFNPNTLDSDQVYYQSWAAKIKTLAPTARNWYFAPSWAVILAYEGANDGLVSTESAQWGNFRGVEDASWYSAGCDHFNIIGQPFGFTPGFDEDQFYIDIAKDLKNRDF